MIFVHGTAWTLYAGCVLTIAGRFVRDWRNPDEDRRDLLIVAGLFAVLFIAAAVIIAVLT
jgi:hypothetical protein